MADDGFTTVVSKSTLKAEKRAATAASEIFIASVPELFNGPINVANLTVDQDIKLTDGPTIMVLCGSELVRERAPKRAFAAVSRFAHDFLKENPKAEKLELPADIVDIDTTKWFFSLLNHRIAAFKISMTNYKSFVKSVKLYEICILLDLDSEITDKLKSRIRGAFSNRLIEYEELNAIVARLPEDDDIFQHAAQNLSFYRHKKAIPDIVDFNVYLGRYPELSNAMDAIDAQHAKARHGPKKGNPYIWKD